MVQDIQNLLRPGMNIFFPIGKENFFSLGMFHGII